MRIETPSVLGSIALKGARIDDLSLIKYRETVDPKSPAVVLLAPSGSPHPFYAEFGWSPPSGATVKLPNSDTVWRQQGSGTLAVGKPVTLVWDNGEGLEFRRTIAIDDKYMFTIKDEVANKSATPVTLYPYALIARHGTPQTLGYYILHEGLIGVFGDKGLQEETYANIEKTEDHLIFRRQFLARLHRQVLGRNTHPRYQDPYRCEIPGRPDRQHQELPKQLSRPRADHRAGRDRRHGHAALRRRQGSQHHRRLQRYARAQQIRPADRLGLLLLHHQALFLAMDWIYQKVGNFGVAILIITVLIKIVFFPLANKSYASMAKMKAVQPEMMAIRERYAEDKMKQQQAMMELYKKEKINPVAGCLPILVQIPVFFALYKVLFVTIDLRHAPFFGWIKDLSAPDPTTIFNLFGLIPWNPEIVPVIGPFLMLGVWPLIMGVTMWFQMKLNPPPPDPTQKMIFDYMPIIFTFMLASFSAGLVIYWAWNNTLSVAQQSLIMQQARRQDRAVRQSQGRMGGMKLPEEPVSKKKVTQA